MSPEARLLSVFILFAIHAAWFFVYLNYQDLLGWILNILVNIYPMIIQIYIGIRCYILISHRVNQKALLLAAGNIQ